ncbi:hypothetical protein CEUSTIGMA_g2540.t1 [Chlamydomonas eustigma]|uniref:Small-subunit processome Utp21 domain-containing protein n=1 Tax=Chlamydomonas eustigma TaxID=1157962 RepID=A0A250WWF4_9CHLO|nr:hypothetical protein CEUSTIGMA_g2540.t1 [Chlamydomonas eustigma]|eukprot:GAX75096.1 hypothetical protein CEUSTIGMA_g2540.t1 [Chlamydomonas eustigma]
MPPSPLFKPFRALGYITDNVPFAVQRRGKETFVTVSVGRTWQVYNCAKLTLVLVGPQLRGDISALACKKDFTYAAVGHDVVACRRMHRYGVYQGSSEHGHVVALMILGESLISLCSKGYLLVWELGKYDTPKTVIELGKELGRPTCMVHPDTYLNKILVGGDGGSLQLANFESGKILHTFKGWGSAVRTVVSSPALDVLGVGLSDGRAVLLNVRFDEEVVTFKNASGVGLGMEGLLGGPQGRALTNGAGGACTAISFRTGGGLPLMAAGGGAGVVTVWNLEERKLHTVLRDAHDGPMVSLHFFPGEPVLMSTAADNSIKHWIFDGPEESGRLLRFRSGHSAPPTCILHYGQGERLLSAGRDRAFRVFSVIQDQQSRELSQRPGGGAAKRARELGLKQEDLKLNKLVAMAAGQVRERDWSNVITAHEGDPVAYVWRLQNFTIGEHRLVPPGASSSTKRVKVATGGIESTSVSTPVTAVALSPCGNFGLVGTSGGRVDRYNMQSGLHRGTYGRVTASNVKSKKEGATVPQGASAALTAHDGAVVGIGVDSCNHFMVTGGVDKQMRVWNFKAMKLVTQISCGASLTHMHLHPSSALCAVAADDLMLRVVDVEANRMVRRFIGHKDRITALQLSSDCRWLLSASLDGTLRVWDVPAGKCLQVMSLGGPPVTALSLSPALDLLATTHSDRRGLYLWANQAVFGNPADIFPSEEVVNVGMPALSTSVSSAQDSEAEEKPQRHSDVLEEACNSDEDEEEGLHAEASKRMAAASEEAAGPQSAAAGPLSYEEKDPLTGAPQPLAPELVTLSLLPRSQWQSLMHLDAIKERNKPLLPPKKLEAAPFFLPTVAGLNTEPVFDINAAPSAPGGEPFFESTSSRILKAGAKRDSSRKPGLLVSELVNMIRMAASGTGPERYKPLLAMLRGMSAAAIDRELKAMQVLEGSDAADQAEGLKDLGMLLKFMQAQLGGGEGGAAANFEFCQALLQLILQIHGDSIMSHPQLVVIAQSLLKSLKPAWGKVEGLIQDVRCMVQFFGNLQG